MVVLLNPWFTLPKTEELAGARVLVFPNTELPAVLATGVEPKTLALGCVEDAPNEKGVVAEVLAACPKVNDELAVVTAAPWPKPKGAVELIDGFDACPKLIVLVVLVGAIEPKPKGEAPVA